MTPEDAAKILALVQVYDNRNFDEMTAQVWADALDGLELGDCLDAVRIYYRQTKTWLMPSDLREQARSVIRGRRERERQESERLAIEAGNLDPQTVSERMETIKQAIADACKIPAEKSPHPKADDSLARGARKVPCPWCGAAKGDACTNSANGRRLPFVHEKRLKASLAAAS